MKMLNIGLDLDGVVYDYAASVRQYLSVALDRPLESFPDPTEYRFAELWCPGMSEEEFAEHIHAGVDAGVIFGFGVPYSTGIASSVSRLMQLGHQVHVVTARSAGSPGRAQEATEAWLRNHYIGYSSLTLTTDKTSVPCEVFIEDYLGNIDALEANGTTCWVVNRPWNQMPDGMADPPGRYRVDSVVEAALQIADWALTDAERDNLNRPAAREEESTRG